MRLGGRSRRGADLILLFLKDAAAVREVAARKPTSLSALSVIEGIGDTKLERHGESLLAALAMAMESDNAPAA